MRGVDTHGFRCEFVLSNGLPSATYARVFQSHVDDDGEHQDDEQQVVILHGPADGKSKPCIGTAKTHAADLNRLDAGNAARTVGEIKRLRQVIQKNANNLAEAQGDDGEIVASQFQSGRTEQHTEHASDQGADGQNHPEG